MPGHWRTRRRPIPLDKSLLAFFSTALFEWIPSFPRFPQWLCTHCGGSGFRWKQIHELFRCFLFGEGCFPSLVLVSPKPALLLSNWTWSFPPSVRKGTPFARCSGWKTACPLYVGRLMHTFGSEDPSCSRFRRWAFIMWSSCACAAIYR